MKQRTHIHLLVFMAISLAWLELAIAQDEKQLQWLVKGVPDPAIIESRDGSGYYIFATGKGIAIWHSQD